MKRRIRIRYTDSQKTLMWDRWQKGESLHQIARLFDRHHSSVRGILAETGGIRPPARRRRRRSSHCWSCRRSIVGCTAKPSCVNDCCTDSPR